MGDQGRYGTNPMRGFTASWVRSTKHLSNSVRHLYRGVAEANRAFLPVSDGADGALEATDDAFGAVDEGTDDGGPDDGRPGAGAVVVDPAYPEIAFSDAEWTVERTAETRADLGVGDSVTFSKRVSEDDVRSFAHASGDTNRLHLDDEFADETRFGGRIVHGTLVGSLISAALARLPGLTIYLSQDLRFLKPVDIGDTLTADCEIVEDLGDDRYRLTTAVNDGDEETVIDGEAVVLIDEFPDV